MCEYTSTSHNTTMCLHNIYRRVVAHLAKQPFYTSQTRHNVVSWRQQQQQTNRLGAIRALATSSSIQWLSQLPSVTNQTLQCSSLTANRWCIELVYSLSLSTYILTAQPVWLVGSTTCNDYRRGNRSEGNGLWPRFSLAGREGSGISLLSWRGHLLSLDSE